MSVLDEAKQRILTRLTELEPGRREYEELLAAAGDLKLDYDPEAAMKHNGNGIIPRAARTGSRSGSSRRRTSSARRQAPRGKRREQVLEVVSRHPDGITVADVAKELGLKDATSLFRVQKALVAEQAVRKDGPKMFPVGEPVPAS